MEAEVKARIGCTVKQAWGMSELSPIGTVVPEDKLRPGSIGQLVPNTLAKIVSTEGDGTTPLAMGEIGELCIKGPQVMQGYLDEPDKTAECLSDDGWLRTGDICAIDEDGFIFVKDRLKELIKYKGYQVGIEC